MSRGKTNFFSRANFRLEYHAYDSYHNKGGVDGTHNGVDLVGGTDASAATDYVIAFESGIVMSVRDDISGKTPSEGNSIIINHGDGFYSYYYHLKSVRPCASGRAAPETEALMSL